MSDSTQHASVQPGRPRGVGVWLAYVLLIVVLATAAYAIWLVLKACGFQLFGRTMVFSWCQEPPAIVRDLSELEERNRLLRNQIHDTQLALMTPGACGPVIDLTPEPELDPVIEPEPVEEAAVQCAPDQVLAQPSEVAIVLDGSGSMQYSVDVPEQLERQYLEAGDAANRGATDFLSMLRTLELQNRAASLDQQLRNYPGRSRIQVARNVLDEAVQKAPGGLSLDRTYFKRLARYTAQTNSAVRHGI